MPRFLIELDVEGDSVEIFNTLNRLIESGKLQQGLDELVGGAGHVTLVSTRVRLSEPHPLDEYIEQARQETQKSYDALIKQGHTPEQIQGMARAIMTNRDPPTPEQQERVRKAYQAIKEKQRG